jgi:transposase-like protein
MNDFFAMSRAMSKEVEVVAGKVKMILSEDAKKKLVLESFESGLGLNQFARQRGISPASLCQWRKKYPIESMDDSQVDIESLKAENESLKSELFKMKAYLGHKLFELDASRF